MEVHIKEEAPKVYAKVEAIGQYVLPDIRLSGSSLIYSATGKVATWTLKGMLYTRHCLMLE